MTTLPKMLKQFAHHGSIYALSAIISRGLALVTVPIYAYLLEPTDFGALDLIFTAGILLTLVVALEIGQGLAREWSELEDPEARRIMVSTALCFTVLAHGCFLIAALPFSSTLSQVLYNTANRASIIQVGLIYISGNALYIQLQSLFRWSMQPFIYSVVSIIHGLLTLALGYIFGSKWGVTGILSGQALAAYTIIIISAWILRTQICVTIDTKVLRGMLAYSLPLALAGVAAFISFHANRFILNIYATLNEVAYYAIAAKMATVSGLLTLGIQTALTPLIYHHHKAPETPSQLARLFEYFTVAAFTLSFGLTLFAQEFLLFFSGPAYLPGASLLAWLIPATLLSQMYIFFPGLALARRSNIQLWITVASSLFAIGLNFILIPMEKGRGAAISTFVTAGVYFFLWAKISQSFYKIPIHTKRVIIAASFYLILVSAIPMIDSIEISPKSLIAIKLATLAGAAFLFFLTSLPKKTDYAS